MSFISYAQNFEDVMLWRALRHVGKGFYVDVGAGGPDAGSSTRALYERGWHGINLEPSREPHAALLVARPADINLQLVAGAEAAGVTFYDAGGDSTLDETRARALSAAGRTVIQRQLEQQTLSAVCAAHAGADIHFMKIDAAGFEQAALAGLDLARWRPWILVVANRGAAAWRAQLAGARYELAWNDGMHDFYVAAEHPELRAAFATPPSAADGFVLREDHPYAYPLDGWRAREAGLQAAATAAESSAREARAWAEARVLEHEEEAAKRETALERALAESHERAEQAERAEQLARERTAFYEGTLHAVYHSASWRITRPLRSLNFRQKALRAKVRAMGGRLRLRVAGMRRAGAGLLKGAVRRVVLAIMSRPKISFFVRSQIGRHPRLTNWLRVAVQRTQATAPLPSMEDSAGLDNLPSAARQVLDDLRRTMKSARPQKD